MVGVDGSIVARCLLEGDAPEVAPQLLGKLLRVAGCTGRIVEVEAYTADDPASHSVGGRTGRNASMFGRAGSLYVYLSYGIHHCANIVTGGEGDGQAVLIRAVVPLAGIEQMRRRRGSVEDRRLADGPGKLCQAFGIDRGDDGADVCRAGGRIQLLDDGVPVVEPVVGRRVGISRATDRPWRWRVREPG